MFLRRNSTHCIRPWPAFACLLSLSLGLLGCGHPASKEECQEIFDRNAAIQLASIKVVEPAQVRERTDEARAAQGEELLKQCVGRRITDRAMRCVRTAQTAEQLEACVW